MAAKKDKEGAMEKGFLEDRIEKIRARNQVPKKPTEEPRAEQKIIPFPVTWSDPERGVPSCVLRSALFGVVMRGRRPYLDRHLVACWPNVSIRYSGPRLDQGDLDVWLFCLHVARRHGLGRHIPVSGYSILRDTGRNVGRRDYEWLKSVLARLKVTGVEITVGDSTYTGSLIEEFYRDEKTQTYALLLNPKLANLFTDESFTRLDWDTRRRLRTDLAKWVDGYVRTQRAEADAPHRINLRRLHELCGSQNNIRDFRYRLKKAMESLQEAGVVTCWQITKGDALEFVRPRRQAGLDRKF